MCGWGPAERGPSRFSALKAGPEGADPGEGHLVLQELTGKKEEGAADTNVGGSCLLPPTVGGGCSSRPPCSEEGMRVS